MRTKRQAGNFRQDFNFSPFAYVSIGLRYPDADTYDMIAMKKEDLKRLGITAGDAILLEISKLDY